ncbi:MAG TPA: AlwI family type II restriction endonuclease [Spirochaetia bacterium]|nr:MAG: hypothetical protein A2Y41_05845 [Spirochaetes bacterium GWB1_36_13]HCL57719.1 AlwI family type II restriction endonuclease [Spirochaetia bacterium]
MRFWSISTTVRNPERIRNFLIVLKTMENEDWNKDTQKKFQVLLILNKVYGFGEAQFHKTLSDEQNNWLFSEDLSYEQGESILESKNYVGGGDMRGRQSFNPLEKMGLVYIDNENKIKITSFGNYFLEENYDLGEVFFRSFLKWQYPNPDSNKYKAKDGYNIKPFIATLHLISKVNEICRSKNIKEKGVSKIEFALFFVSLSNYEKIQETAEKIIEFRENYEKINDNKKEEYLKNYFNNNFCNFESLENALEYTDNIIRYFRLTRYIYIRGKGWYVDLEPRRKIEIDSIIENDNASAIIFESKENYISYIGDVTKPVLPWENKEKLNHVIQFLINEIKAKSKELIKLGINLPKQPDINLESNDLDYLKFKTEELRIYRRTIFDKENHFNAQTIQNTETYIKTLQNIFKINKKRPVELERTITLGLNALNDAIEIKPNYPVGDDNEPTFTAPANKPDIECFYESFNSICEVTLLTDRTQWYNEGQPVMRHIRDFEKKYTDKDTYCIFIAPKLHRDTINTFWISVKYEYEGVKQKIIPITINQFATILEYLIIFKKNNKFLTHQKIRNLFNMIINETIVVSNSEEWVLKIPSLIKKWGELLVS